MKPREIILAGGTGFTGGILTRHFLARGDRVAVLTRRPPAASKQRNLRWVRWDGETLGSWVADLDGAAALVNLAGRSVNCRYHATSRREILESRVRSAQVLATALQRCVRPPPVWVQAASATIYRHAEDWAMDEATGEIGHGFSVEVCRAWEEACLAPPLAGTRRAVMRLAMVMGRGRDGVFAAFDRLVRLGLGGRQGSGRQWMSWIHEEDFARAVEWLIERPDMEGIVNVTAPAPLPNATFLRELRAARRMPLGLPLARWMLEIGAWALRTETELLLKSRRVVPARLLDSGFSFLFPTWPEAANHLVRPDRTLRRGAKSLVHGHGHRFCLPP